MSELDPLLQSFVVGGFGSAVVMGLVRVASEYIKHRRSRSQTRMDEASTADTVSQTYERIVKDLRRDGDAVRRELHILQIQVTALNARIDSNASTAREARDRAEASEHRSARNVRSLQKHIAKLSEIMRSAGLTPPDPPVLEPDPPHYQREDLRDAIPELMHGSIASMGARAPSDDPEDDD